MLAAPAWDLPPLGRVVRGRTTIRGAAAPEEAIMAGCEVAL